jgi:nucleoside 2-deoxyribosyltransferase
MRGPKLREGSMVKKIYLSVPIISDRDTRTALEIARIIRSTGHELISTWVLKEDPNGGLDAAGVFERDSNGVRGCDMIVADVSTPSHGVGMEIMLAHSLGKEVICVYRQGSKLSWMIRGLPGASLIEFKDGRDLREKLSMKLRGKN